MDNTKIWKILRIFFIVNAIAAVVLPIAFVLITGMGFTPFAVRLFVSMFLLCVICAIQCGPKPQDPLRRNIRLFASLALGYLLISQWIFG